MQLLQLAWKNIRNEPLNSLLSILLLSLGIAMMTLVMHLSAQFQQQLKRNIKDIDMVVGAKGSPLQLILSSVYQVDYPTGNISLAAAQKLVKNRMVKFACPLAYGDSYQGFRIVGTDEQYIETFSLELAQGVWWSSVMEVVLGDKVARESKLKIGDTFYSNHGLTDGHVHEEAAYRVVGILKASDTVANQLILSSVQSLWKVHEKEDEHDHEHDEDHDHDQEHNHANTGEHDASLLSNSHSELTNVLLDTTLQEKEITALFVKFKTPIATMSIPRQVNETTMLQAAAPKVEMQRLRKLMGTGERWIKLLAYLILVLSGVSIFLALFNSLRSRQYELALMRSLGASRFKLFTLIIIESMVLAFIGIILGAIISRILLFFTGSTISARLKYQLQLLELHPDEPFLWLLVFLFAIIAAIIPAIIAYKTDIAKAFSNV